ncbi:hypothetical protein L3Y19_gp007 [Gordonia phage Neville]|uniref:Uncharacterized protein n=2 Tax=Nevillevirus TaxID=3044773 RepID=A0A515MH64_9CAUD|nr:hypothetical protein L3Y19_gp007 [Gordonia phage Neville]YP_010245992.1 hypothetical protein L3Y20_gp007 [Gordonia phage Trax]AXQ64380.1 hypothetical protein SEA_NEVILLE_7 [Gordonia phage Neville]QDM55894.1 hypothetical protein SEA_TRAX_7 [Gordonia phage Trax]
MEYTYGRQARHVAHLNDQTPWHFGIHHTGGGCMALQANLSKDYEVLITHECGDIIPDERYGELNLSDFTILVGIYDLRTGYDVTYSMATPVDCQPSSETDAIMLALTKALDNFKKEPNVDLDLSTIYTEI